MSSKSRTSPKRTESSAGTRPGSVPTHHARWCLAGIAVGLGWTAFGCGIAAVQGCLPKFLEAWFSLQGFFLVGMGIWLLSIVRSGSFAARVSALMDSAGVPDGILTHRGVQIGIAGLIGALGTASLVALRIDAEGAVLYFMWGTCAAVCFTAGSVTVHALEVITTISRLQAVPVKVFHYAPARTPELRSVVNYFSSFTLLVTIGYAFALLGTLDSHWRAPKDYVDAVRLFWPFIYVPICSTALVYPHVVVHRIIQREKERTLASYQRDIDDMLLKYSALKAEEVSRTNSLAELFDRISASPDYVIDFGVPARTILPLAFNLATLLIKATAGPARS